MARLERSPIAALRVALATAGIVLAIGPNSFAQNPLKTGSGEALFVQQCGTCHSTTRDSDGRAGPSLYGVVGRIAGTLPDFEYSPALKRSEIIWTRENLDRWLSDSSTTVPDSYMNFRQADAAKRKAIIDFLGSLPRKRAKGVTP